MKIKINQFKVSIKNKDIPLKNLIEKKYHIFIRYINDVIVSKESIDARDKNNIFLVYNLIVDIDDSKYDLVKDNKFITIYDDKPITLDYKKYNLLIR